MGRRATALRIAAAVVVVAVLVWPGAVPAATAQVAPADRTEPGTIGPGPTAVYLDALARLFVGRTATAEELRAWTPLVHRDSRASVAAALARSDEWAGREVDLLYREILGREPDDAGRRHWVRAVAEGIRLEDVASRLYGSTEKWRAVGATEGGFVDDLYRTLLGRDPDADGRAHWIDELRSGRADRTAVATRFHGALEARRDRVRARYVAVLGREPDGGGLAHWAEQLTRLGDVALTVQLAASPELHLRATGVLPAAVRFVDVGPGTAYPLRASWREGCPVHHRDLVAVEFPHWTDEGKMRTGVLVVHRLVATDVAFVARTLHGTRFPLTSARPIDDFGGDDDRSMAADNSSAFNCRVVAGTTTWSTHAYGTAVDLNPERNPHVRDGEVDPPSGAAWTDRSDVRPGMIVDGGPVVRAFDEIAWGWGGRWRSAKDYQHFSASGR